MRWNDWARENGSMALNRVASARQGTALAVHPARIMPRPEQDVCVLYLVLCRLYASIKDSFSMTGARIDATKARAHQNDEI